MHLPFILRSLDQIPIGHHNNRVRCLQDATSTETKPDSEHVVFSPLLTCRQAPRPGFQTLLLGLPHLCHVSVPTAVAGTV
jgi:hypothetical protein